MTDNNLTEQDQPNKNTPPTNILAKISFVLNVITIIGAICLEPMFALLAVFCADGPPKGWAETWLGCAIPLGFLPIIVSGIFIAGARFASSRKNHIAELILSCAPIIIGLITVAFIHYS